jgi:purine-binding chemotaxis protein CheW
MSGVHVRVRAGGERYALAVNDVTEVGELGEVTPLPGSPPEVLGLHNLRGQVVPVVDLAEMLGIGGRATPTRVVIAESGARRAGLAVEGVDGVDELPEHSEESDSPLLSGAVLIEGELVGVVHARALLDALAPEEAP